MCNKNEKDKIIEELRAELATSIKIRDLHAKNFEAQLNKKWELEAELADKTEKCQKLFERYNDYVDKVVTLEHEKEELEAERTSMIHEHEELLKMHQEQQWESANSIGHFKDKIKVLEAENEKLKSRKGMRCEHFQWRMGNDRRYGHCMEPYCEKYLQLCTCLDRRTQDLKLKDIELIQTIEELEAENADALKRIEYLQNVVNERYEKNVALTKQLQEMKDNHPYKKPTPEEMAEWLDIDDSGDC